MAGFLVLSWQAGVPTVTQASLGSIAVPSGVGLYVMATILELASCPLRSRICSIYAIYAPCGRKSELGKGGVQNLAHKRSCNGFGFR